jgi:hypothetical protein
MVVEYATDRHQYWIHGHVHSLAYEEPASDDAHVAHESASTLPTHSGSTLSVSSSVGSNTAKASDGWHWTRQTAVFRRSYDVAHAYDPMVSPVLPPQVAITSPGNLAVLAVYPYLTTVNGSRVSTSVELLNMPVDTYFVAASISTAGDRLVVTDNHHDFILLTPNHKASTSLSSSATAIPWQVSHEIHRPSELHRLSVLASRVIDFPVTYRVRPPSRPAAAASASKRDPPLVRHVSCCFGVCCVFVCSVAGCKNMCSWCFVWFGFLCILPVLSDQSSPSAKSSGSTYSFFGIPVTVQVFTPFSLWSMYSQSSAAAPRPTPVSASSSSTSSSTGSASAAVLTSVTKRVSFLITVHSHGRIASTDLSDVNRKRLPQYVAPYPPLGQVPLSGQPSPPDADLTSIDADDWTGDRAEMESSADGHGRERDRVESNDWFEDMFMALDNTGMAVEIILGALAVAVYLVWMALLPTLRAAQQQQQPFGVVNMPLPVSPALAPASVSVPPVPPVPVSQHAPEPPATLPVTYIFPQPPPSSQLTRSVSAPLPRLLPSLTADRLPPPGDDTCASAETSPSQSSALSASADVVASAGGAVPLPSTALVQRAPPPLEEEL